jgi:hypothetical protein
MRCLTALLLTLLPAFGQPVRTSHLDLRAQADAAYQRKDYAAAREALREALSLRPDSPHYLHQLAAISALLEDREAALGYLRQIAALGVAAPVERDPDLALLQGTTEFMRLHHAFEANRAPRGEAVVLAELPGRTGIIEGIAYLERSGEVFLGDVHHRCIWRRDRDGRVVRYTAEDDELLGVFAVAIDEPRNALWAAMSAVPEMTGYAPEMKGRAALAEFDLASSEIRRIVPVPVDGRDHGLSDLTIAPDGTVYATDTKSPVVWLLAPDAEELQIAVDSPVFASLQGVILERRTLLVADYVNGLFTIDLATRNVTALPAPKNVTLVGLDGLVTVPGGLVATQNGVEPQRVIHVTFTPELDAVTRVNVLAAALPDLTDLSLLTRMNDRLILVAGSGWEGLDLVRSPQPPPHSVRIFQLALP